LILSFNPFGTLDDCLERYNNGLNRFNHILGGLVLGFQEED